MEISHERLAQYKAGGIALGSFLMTLIGIEIVISGGRYTSDLFYAIIGTGIVEHPVGHMHPLVGVLITGIGILTTSASIRAIKKIEDSRSE